jgi:hypothetical protein
MSRVRPILMKLPITLIEQNGDRTDYSSVEEAELAMEPVDVQNGEYVAQDADGQTLVIRVVEEPTPVLFGLLRAQVKKARIRRE